MASDRSERAKRVCDAARSLTAEQREAVLASLDPSLREEVESLLTSYEEDDTDSETVEKATARRPGTAGAVRSLLVGQTLQNRYEIRARLGRGGMGEIWRAFDLKLRVEVALKSLRKDAFANERTLELLRQEVRSAREVASPNVCRIFDLVEVHDQELVSMEYIDGATLLEVLETRGPLPVKEAAEIAAQLLAGLEAIHRAGFVHRDVKPENIMITRAGRVVIMDFGIAKAVTEKRTGTVSGTPAYMAPEQISGTRVDARTDIYAAGIVLAEMVSGEGVRERSSRERLWSQVREEPPQLHETPWRTVLTRALAKEPDSRYPTAQSLAQALEEATFRVEGAEDKKPYPGLESFTETDAQFFFGREAEVETAWKKLRRLHLMALIGPSGAGKSSLIRAGLLPTRPDGWGIVVAKPGGRPFAELARALAPELAGDADAVDQLVRMDDLDVAVAAVTRWRKRHQEALVVLDQFEELFTLNPPEVQARFSELVGRLVIECDVRVLLCLRDDFLLRCHDYEPLEPVFSDLLPLKPPGGDALRRAVVQPALLCGYRLEDEALVEEMVGEVVEERGALPLLAFTMARLWAKRDRDTGSLTRAAYKEIGGVGGALAQHAEATLSRIGVEATPIVREVFRNLVTGQGTRAAHDMDELLSVFSSEPDTAREVIRELVDARLLTAFDVSDVEGSGGSRQRVEIVHESLLSAWPRLVRWRTQDADSAQIRDQLRQASQLWQERGRPDELLWTGASFREFELWRELYPGGLTTTEEAFADAMVRDAERRKRRRRLLTTTAIGILVAIAAVFAMLWHQSELARRESVAAQLVALGRLHLEDFPTAALAYSLASLEQADSPDARRFAVDALSRGPTAFMLTEDVYSVAFSPDGRWLATLAPRSGVRLWSRDGGPPKRLGGADEHFADAQRHLQFSPDSGLLVSTSGRMIRFWSLPGGEEIRKLELEGSTISVVRGSRLITFTKGPDELEIVRSWPLTGGKPTLLARWDARDVTRIGDIQNLNPDEHVTRSVDADGEHTTYARGKGVYVCRLDELGRGGERLIGEHPADVIWSSFHPVGRHIVSADERGEVRFWPLTGRSMVPERTLHGRIAGEAVVLDVDPTGARLVASGAKEASDAGLVWDLRGPPDADPLVLRNSETKLLNRLALHPQGDWVATSHTVFSGVVWPLNRSYASVLQGHAPPWVSVRFTVGGKALVSSSHDGTLRLWPLSPDGGERSRILLDDETALLGQDLVVDPTGEYVVAISSFDPRVFLVPLEGGETRLIPSPDGSNDVQGPAFSPDGRLVAIAGFSPAYIRVFDLASGETRDFDPRIGDEHCGLGENMAGGVFDLEFTDDAHLLSSGATGLRRWDLESGTSELLLPCRKGLFRFIAVSADRRRALAWDFDLAKQRRSVLTFLDLEKNTSREITSHGNRIFFAALDPSGTTVATGDFDGVVRVGPVSGEEPHLLYGHRPGFMITSVAISPDGRYVASAADDGTIRVWPMPEGRPFHTLPYEEFLGRIRALTNLRVVPDDDAETGYRFEVGPFPGWKTTPTW